MAGSAAARLASTIRQLTATEKPITPTSTTNAVGRSQRAMLRRRVRREPADDHADRDRQHGDPDELQDRRSGPRAPARAAAPAKETRAAPSSAAAGW